MNKPKSPNAKSEMAHFEQRFRGWLREELVVAHKSEAASPLTFWGFLNSQFALFLLGAIFVSGLGGALTYWHQMQHEKEVKYEKARKLLAEFDFRLNELDFRVTNILTKPESDIGIQRTYIWRVARGDKEFQPALPEFRNVHWAGLAIQIDTLGFGVNTAQAVQAARDLENGYPLYAPGFLELRSKELHEFSSAAWLEVDPRRMKETNRKTGSK